MDSRKNTNYNLYSRKQYSTNSLNDMGHGHNRNSRLSSNGSYYSYSSNSKLNNTASRNTRSNATGYLRSAYSSGYKNSPSFRTTAKPQVKRSTVTILGIACIILAIILTILVFINIPKFSSFASLNSQISQTNSQIEEINSQNEELQNTITPMQETIDKYNALKIK